MEWEVTSRIQDRFPSTVHTCKLATRRTLTVLDKRTISVSVLILAVLLVVPYSLSIRPPMPPIPASRLRIAWTTLPNEAAAKSLAQQCVSASLAACAQVSGPITSFYHWEGKLDTSVEWRLTLKYPSALEGPLSAFVHQHHSYTTPQWVSVAADGSEKYAAWVEETTRQPGDDVGMGRMVAASGLASPPQAAEDPVRERRVGGTGPVLGPDDIVRSVVDKLHADILAKAEVAAPAAVEVLGYRKQVVSGMNYFIKIRIGESPGAFFHLRVYQPLGGKPPLLQSLEKNHSRDDDISYF